MHGTSINPDNTGKQAHGSFLLRRLHTRIIVHGYAWSIYNITPAQPVQTAWKVSK